MIAKTYNLRFITPCFCAGAEQAAAEVRAPSIRGKLRWWFRVLGGTPAEEAEVFGAIYGDEGRSSAIVVRARECSAQSNWQPIQYNANSNTGYLLYFAKASANESRWVPTGALPIGSGFELQVLWRRKISLVASARFDLAIEAFLLLGSLGLRSTRGLGCFQCLEFPFSEAALSQVVERIKESAPAFIVDFSGFVGGKTQLIDALGAQLRGLRSGWSAGAPGRSNPTPLGSSGKPRQTSAVHLRPVQIDADNCRIVVFEAPALKVLGPESRRNGPRLKNGVPAPMQAPPPHRNFGGRQR